MRRFLLAVLVLVIILAGATAWRVYRRALEPYKGYQAAERFVDLRQGSGASEIGRRLVEAGVVRDTLTFQVALWLSGEARHLQAGEYRFDRPMTPAEVLDKIRRGEVYEHRVTFPEGLTIAEMAALFESRGLGTAASFMEAANDASLVNAYDPNARDLEGYLFPETYALPRGTPASTLVRLMVDRFEEAFPSELRHAVAERGLPVRQAVTLASLVEKETPRDDERPLVAAVYLNRLEKRMPMQCDPTVIYALRKAGKYNGNLTREHLEFDSPYNTYRYPGLPPGPIAAPGRPSLEAAALPAAVDYLYFVSRNDGSHVFASTLAEHNRNVRKYQVDYFRDKRLQGQNNN
jgi:UPF0755 protein